MEDVLEKELEKEMDQWDVENECENLEEEGLLVREGERKDLLMQMLE